MTIGFAGIAVSSDSTGRARAAISGATPVPRDGVLLATIETPQLEDEMPKQNRERNLGGTERSAEPKQSPEPQPQRQKEQEQVKGSGSSNEPSGSPRPQRQPGRLPLPD
jgi:hypothetical protein